MPDNVAITAGSGTTIATDDVAGVHYQIVKLAAGALDTATLLKGTADGALCVIPRYPTQSYRASAIVTAPAIGAVIADSGAVAAGKYRVEFTIGNSDTVAVGKGIVLEYRNAANGATTHSLAMIGAADAMSGEIAYIDMALNERVRAIAGTVAGAASSRYHAYITLYPLP